MPNDEVRVVVVEDDPDARETLKELLEISGYAVSTAGDAPAAMELIQSCRPTCVLLDLGLPDTAHGLALTAWLQARFGPTVIVVVVTGSIVPADLEAAQSAGADYVLNKPIDIDRLNTILMPMR